MKKVSLTLIILMLSILPCKAKSPFEIKIDKISQSSVFVYHIPDEDEGQEETTPAQTQKEEPIITSDDVTADTSIKPNDNEEEEEVESDEEYNNVVDEEDENTSGEYEMGDMYTDVLKGYAEYNEEEANTITLDDSPDELLKLDITKPAKVAKNDYTSLKSSSLNFYDNQYSKYTGSEYNIAPKSSTNYRKYKGFSAGTTYDQCIDYAEFEQSSGVFSRYEYKNWAIRTAYSKTVNSTNNNYNDNFYFSPEWKVNQFFSLREVFSADIAKHRKKAEVVLSINPFGNKDSDRMRLEFGASQSYSNTNQVLRSQLKFSTNFKL